MRLLKNEAIQVIFKHCVHVACKEVQFDIVRQINLNAQNVIGMTRFVQKCIQPSLLAVKQRMLLMISF